MRAAGQTEAFADLADPRVLIVCGGRDYRPDAEDLAWLRGIVMALEINIIRHGDARGVDRAAGEFGKRIGLLVHAVPARPDDLDDRGRRLGRRAFPIRNREMLRLEPRPVAVAALPGGVGTDDMITCSRAAGVLVLVSPRIR